MKYHLGLWRETAAGTIIAACGVVSRPDNFVMGIQAFLANAKENPTDTCKRCKRILDKKTWCDKLGCGKLA